MIRIFHNQEIEQKDVQQMINAIIESRLEIPKSKDLDESEFTELSSSYVDENIYCWLANDWYLLFSLLNNKEIEILFLESMLNPMDKFKQGMDMYLNLKQFFLTYSDYIFNACLNKYSLPLYLIGLRKGFFKEIICEKEEDYTNVIFKVNSDYKRERNRYEKARYNI